MPTYRLKYDISKRRFNRFGRRGSITFAAEDNESALAEAERWLTNKNTTKGGDQYKLIELRCIIEPARFEISEVVEVTK